MTIEKSLPNMVMVCVDGAITHQRRQKTVENMAGMCYTA